MKLFININTTIYLSKRINTGCRNIETPKTQKVFLAITSAAGNGLTGWLVNQQGNTISVAFYLPRWTNNFTASSNFFCP
jgi:hypothetical protein